MKIFKDCFTGSELFSDSLKYKLVDDLYYEVDGKMISRDAGSFDAFIGSNPSAEEDQEALEDTSEKGIDVVMNHNLMEVPFEKKAYLTYLKQYMKKLIERVEKQRGKEVAESTKTKLNDFFSKTIIPKFKDFQFFVGENFDDDGMVILMNYREDGTTPYFIFLKDGLEEEKF